MLILTIVRVSRYPEQLFAFQINVNFKKQKKMFYSNNTCKKFCTGTAYVIHKKCCANNSPTKKISFSGIRKPK